MSSIPIVPKPPTLPNASVRNKGNSIKSPTGRPGFRGRFRLISPVVSQAPMDPQRAIKDYAKFLTEYEKKEILSFPDIYFVGDRRNKIIPDMSNEFNMGFDDDSNNYKLVVGDHLAYRFEIVGLFGSGAFGQIAKCFDHRTKQAVAVKVIVNTEQMHEQGQIEAQILSKLHALRSRHIVKAFDFFVFRSHVCITFEILGKNLYEISEGHGFKRASIRLVRSYASQMFSALQQIHRIGVMHCDIKPENVLVVPKNNALIKIIDFGSGCFDGYQKYEYIQSRFYRAPEVILALPYGPSIDIWSTALVLIELLIGMPLLQGESEEEMLLLMTEVMGPAPEEVIAMSSRSDEFFDENGHLRTEKTVRKINLKRILQTQDDYLVDFLMKCLTWEQEKRMTASQALQHPWMRMQQIQMSVTATGELPDLRRTAKSARSMY